MKMVQVFLRSGSSFRTCWIEKIAKVGDQISLKDSEDPKRLWTILSISSSKEDKDIKRHLPKGTGGL